jgi:hypothetical protein
MPRSTASFIAYDVRPAKQIERRAIVDFLGAARNAGYNISDYRYVGLGGTKFIDFQLMQRYVGLYSYTSIEHDEEIFGRCVFNRPFESIQMYPGTFSQFLILDENPQSSVYWMDLEIPISTALLSNLQSIAEHVIDGDIVFITFRAEPPSGTKNKGDAERKRIISDRFPAFRAIFEKEKPVAFSDRSFGRTAGKIALKMIESAFATRVEGSFRPLMRVLYQDSSLMCTIGGVFARKGSKKGAALAKLVQSHLAPICGRKKYSFFFIPTFNFTELERILLDKSDIETGTGYSRRLTTLGLPENDMKEYQRLARFVPRYVEAAF